MIDRQHVHRKSAFQCGMLIKIVQYDVSVCVSFQLKLDPGVLIRQIADIADLGYHLVLDQGRNAPNQLRAIDIEGDLSDDDRFPVLSPGLDRGFSPYLQTATASLKILANPAGSIERAPGRKIWSFDQLKQTIDRDFGIIDQLADRIDNLSKIVRRDICCHPYGDPGSPV